MIARFGETCQANAIVVILHGQESGSVDMSIPPRFKAATLHDVAREAGVSLITASRALGNPSLVSKKTIARVQDAVATTGYIPNLLAGGLKSNRSMTIGGVVPAISVAQFLPTLETLTGSLAAAGYQLILGQTGYDPGREEALIAAMLSRRPDGIVVTGLVHSQAARNQLRRAGIPVVETWDLSDRPVDMLVGFSHLKVGSAIAGYFLGKGWQRVGIVTRDDHRGSMRREGFLATIGRDLPIAVVRAPSSVELGRHAFVELLRQDPKLEAVYCSSDQLAQGVIVEALERGLRVPDDLAVCGFGDADFSAHVRPSLTTVHVEGRKIGELAARLIIDRCRLEPIASPIVDVGFHIVERQSSSSTGSQA